MSFVLLSLTPFQPTVSLRHAAAPPKDFPVNLSVIPDLTMQGADSPFSTRPTVTVGRLAGLVRELAASPGDWWHLARFDGVPVRLLGEAEVWLSAWPPGHRAAPVADVLAVLAGELSERTITDHGVAERAVRANRIRVYGAGHPRELVNPGPAYAVSLHATV
ncbi:cupin domain-containing protein [Actinoallomurus rhizosphaericola]|uniref:cysteine dioxygenase n=1 Tax=Actinoallomurus rhizosphaericola TaxID=2952536 RepID=UPI0020928DF1|nr:cysteine dioxygenase [Actinoallomurus rhizosphaericola]MCO5999162.1 cysteine dioxygenase [Actinoallomurus rhizosphaericola]